MAVRLVRLFLFFCSLIFIVLHKYEEMCFLFGFVSFHFLFGLGCWACRERYIFIGMIEADVTPSIQHEGWREIALKRPET